MVENKGAENMTPKDIKNCDYDRFIPPTLTERERLAGIAVRFIAEAKLQPPLSLEELEEFAAALIETNKIDPVFSKWMMVMINNEVWRETIAATPRERRMLMLPQCLRHFKSCPAPADELGLICQNCGACDIGRLEQEADELGMMTLIAEGSSLVAGLLDSGQFDAVIGVSCLEALEKAFPYMVAHAVPGIAIPLTRSGCQDTAADIEVVRQAMRMNVRPDIHPVNLEQLSNHVKEWFSPGQLEELMGPPLGAAEIVAREWMAGDGKRWRPFIAAAVYSVLTDNQPHSTGLRQAAIAVESFHKASLIHDDIEDDDDFRYGRAALHRSYNLPIALNAGDALLGEGYRLLSICEVPDHVRAEMIKVAANAHRNLCRGQGDELEWRRNPVPLRLAQVIEIFRGKTSPAFEVSLALGALCAGAPAELCGHLKLFSNMLGIAYQIKDDLDDFQLENDKGWYGVPQLSVILAAAGEIAPDRERLFKHLLQCKSAVEAKAAFAAEVELEKVIAKVRQLLEHYHNEAVRALRPVNHSGLKRLLFRIAGKLLHDSKKNKDTLTGNL